MNAFPVKECLLCGGDKFEGYEEFNGSTLKFKDQKFTYACCQECLSIINLSCQYPDYSGYPMQTEYPPMVVKRFLSLIKLAGIKKNDAILDYGCGHGALMTPLCNRGFNVSGYDPFIDPLKEVGDKTFDLIYLYHVIEHFRDLEGFFKKITEHSKKGTKIITIHPSSTRLPDKIDPKNIFLHNLFHSPFHLSLPSDLQLEKLFSNYGFQKKIFYPYDYMATGYIYNAFTANYSIASLGNCIDYLYSYNNMYIILHSIRKMGFTYIKAILNASKFPYISTFVFEKN